MSDDRAERLRERRQESKQRAEQVSSSEQSQSSKPSKSSEPSKSDDGGSSVKDEYIGTYMYLPEDLKQELGPTFKIIAAEYEREFGRELEKNRHFYPLVVKHGLDGLDGLDASEIQDKLDELDLV